MPIVDIVGLEEASNLRSLASHASTLLNSLIDRHAVDRNLDDAYIVSIGLKRM